jgi:hypothetical protein
MEFESHTAPASSPVAALPAALPLDLLALLPLRRCGAPG